MYPTEEIAQDLALLEDSDSLPTNPTGEPGEVNPEQSIITDDDINKAILDIIKEYETRDDGIRQKMVRLWRKCELYMDGIQSIIWDEHASDFRSATDAIRELDQRRDEFDPYYYDKIVNIFRAFAESVIAALSQEVPPVIFPPDNADDVNDVNTSRGYTKISELIAKHNQAPMLLVRALFTLWNQGCICAYTYTKEDASYGTVKTPQIKMMDEPAKAYSCPICGNSLDEAPDIDGNIMCDKCGYQGPPDEEYTTIKVPRIVGESESPKSRECIEIFGPLDVFFPHYVKHQKHIPVLILKSDVHYTYAQELFEKLSDDITPTEYETDERWARSHPEGLGEDEDDILTMRRVWIRSWAFNKYKKNNPELHAELRRLYPNGCYAAVVNDKVAEKEDESLDDRWTISINPMSSHLMAKPLGAPMLPIQEMTNELLLLQLQSIEYGIPETFVEATAINWQKYNEQPAKPGMLYPAKALAGKGIKDSFETLQTAVFPKESIEYGQILEKHGQFVVGAFPSIYGGAMPGGGKTAAEYNMSRNQALQRLSIVWKFVSWWWAQTMSKAVYSFHQNLMNGKTDEHFTKRSGSSWETIWIRREELLGKVGQVEPEMGEGFPQSWAQKKDLLVQLIQFNNDYLNQALFHPENTALLASALGLREFYVPGDRSRNKQITEIALLIQQEPLDEFGEQPSIPIDPDLDEHPIELEACRAWMISEYGQDAKMNNPAGYANVRAHAAQHLMMVQMAAEQEQEQEEENKNNKNQPSEVTEGD